MAPGTWGCVGARVARPPATFRLGPSLALGSPAGRPLRPQPPPAAPGFIWLQWLEGIFRARGSPATASVPAPSFHLPVRAGGRPGPGSEGPLPNLLLKE